MIYFIRDSASGRVKIGYTENPWKRLSELQVASPSDLDLLAACEGDRVSEADLHQRFSASRVRGEWFLPTQDLMAHVATIPTFPKAPRKSSTKSFWGGISAKDLAAASGISPTMLSFIRAGKRRPSPETAIIIQRHTGLSAIKLVFGDLAEEAA